MITALLWLTLTAPKGWVEVKANGFTFEMPAKPTLENGEVTWPTTGKMMRTQWMSKLETGDREIDTVGCYESTVPSLRMIGVLWDAFCKEDAPGQKRFERTDATTQARECLMLGQGPDGKRRTLFKIMEVGSNVCAISASATVDKVTDEPSPQMRRFVDSLKVTGKPTVLSVTPWVSHQGNGFKFELPEKMEPKVKEGSDPAFGKVKTTVWTAHLTEEELSVRCVEGPGVSSAKGLKALEGTCDVPGAKVVRTKLPGGGTECSVSGASKTMLLRIFPMGVQACTAAASRNSGESSQDARRFVESFAKVN